MDLYRPPRRLHCKIQSPISPASIAHPHPNGDFQKTSLSSQFLWRVFCFFSGQKAFFHLGVQAFGEGERRKRVIVIFSNSQNLPIINCSIYHFGVFFHRHFSSSVWELFLKFLIFCQVFFPFFLAIFLYFFCICIFFDSPNACFKIKMFPK